MTYHPPDSDWSEARVTLLRELYPHGTNKWVAQQLNTMTGSSFTKAAVIGKASRIGLLSTFVAPNDPRRNGKVRARKPEPFRPKSRIPFKVDETPTQKEFLGLSLIDLKEGQCRYPRGDDAPYLFCGQPVRDGSSYCSYCHSIVYTGVKFRPAGEYSWRNWKPSNGFKRRA